MTDSRHYARLSPHGVLRFTPWTARKADSDYTRVHGVDERVRVADCACALNMYKTLLRGFGREALGGSAGAAAGAEGDRSEL
jgi:acetylornithine deacetylase/succinyl-diaminopimelate desuccinylase-like protein